MKANIHPQYFDEVVVTCHCGASFTTGSTKQSIRVDICSKCHPLYTGEQKFLDTRGSVDKFKKAQEAAVSYKLGLEKKKTEKKGGAERQQKSLKELLAGM